jgi:parallel beta-helix repeat protein
MALLWSLGGGIPDIALANGPDGHDTYYVAPGTDCGGTTPCYGSVQAAVDAVDSPDDVIKVAAGIYTGVSAREGVTQVVHISKTVTVRGGYTTTNWTTSDPDANRTTLDAQGRGRVLYVTGDISPTLEGLHITGGDATGLLGVPWADLGGGVCVFTATLTLRDSQVFSNTAQRGGGLYLLGARNATLSGNTFISNTANEYGGGLLLDTSDATVSGNTFISNTADWSGGGICLLQGCDGVTLNGNTVNGNSAGTGGGIWVAGSDAMLSENTVRGNTAGGWGGGIALMWENYSTLSGNIIADNAAQDRGGGLFIHGESYSVLTNNVVVDNQADTAGSGLAIQGASPGLLHNTFARNTGGDGSGIHITLDSPPWGDIYSDVALANTILVSHGLGISVTGGNTVTVNAVLWYGAPITVSQSTTATVMVQNQNTGDPAFASDGYHITAASAAMDTGVNAGVTTDIDGHHRPYGSAPDLGADEVFAPSVPPDIESTLVYTDTQGNPTVIQVPTEAVTETTTLIYVPMGAVTAPSGFAFAGSAFDLDAYQDGSLLSSFVFRIPVTITLYYAEADVAGLDEDSLVLQYWNGSVWVDAACGNYDRHPDENWLAVPICHLSRFALFGKYTVYLPLVLRNY